MRHSRTIAAALMAAALAVPVFAQHGTPVNRSADALTVAVFGDWPYSVHLRDTAAAFLLDSINSDPHVRLVVHVGDIHSGSMPCTGAGLNPLPAGSNPGWNESIWDIFQQFHDPFVYTPGDNEWSDCHKVKQFSSGAPLNELAAVRSQFFPTAGLTLGEHPRQVDLAGHGLRLGARRGCAVHRERDLGGIADGVRHDERPRRIER